MSDKLVLKTDANGKRVRNLILKSDAYKYTHWRLYPVGTKTVYSYLESRGSEIPEMDSTMFFGLQIYLKEYLEGVIIEQWMIDEAKIFCKKVFGYDYFNADGWQRIVDVHGGRIPLRLRAVPEGTFVPIHNVLMTLENTDEQLPWVTNFFETLLFQPDWYGTTACTVSFYIKVLIESYCVKTGEHVNPFHLNDFGYRGVSSDESAGTGGAAHLVNFSGTDNFSGIEKAMLYYDTDVCGYSVMATEHSVVEMYKKEFELEAYRHFLDVVPDSAILSSVSDTYDYKNAVENYYCKALHDKIMSRTGKLVIRPDSGFPPEISVWTLQTLWKYFGGTINEKGFKIVDPHVGIIYGDGIDYHMIKKILKAVIDAGFGVSNIIFGMGGALLQKLNRDTFKMAIKASWGMVEGDGSEGRDIWKETITDVSKASKRGRLRLINNDSGVFTYPYPICDPDTNKEIPMDEDVLVTVFENGVITKEYTFDEVRANAQKAFEDVNKKVSIENPTFNREKDAASFAGYAWSESLKEKLKEPL